MSIHFKFKHIKQNTSSILNAIFIYFYSTSRSLQHLEIRHHHQDFYSITRTSTASPGLLPHHQDFFSFTNTYLSATTPTAPHRLSQLFSDYYCINRTSTASTGLLKHHTDSDHTTRFSTAQLGLLQHYQNF